MNYSKLLSILCYLVVVTKSNPIPGLFDSFLGADQFDPIDHPSNGPREGVFGGDLDRPFNDNYDPFYGPTNNTPLFPNSPAEAPIKPPTKAPAEIPSKPPKEEPAKAPVESPKEEPAEKEPVEAPVESPKEEPAEEEPENAPAEAPANNNKGNEVIQDLFGTVINGEVSKNDDITTLITNGVNNVLKNNLCKNLPNELSATCNQISETVINTVNNSLKGIIGNAINAASGNTLSIACSIIPSGIFRNLSTIIIDNISKAVGKNGNVDSDKVSLIARNVVSIIINTVQNLLCVGKSPDNGGNVIFSGISDLISNITNKSNKMEKASFIMNNDQQGINAIIAKDVTEFQERLKNL